MELNARRLLGKICRRAELQRAEHLIDELTQLLRDRKVKPTPLVLMRLEEVVVYYYVVQAIEDNLRDDGVFEPIAGTKGATDAGNAAAPARKLSPHVEHAVKARERLGKSIKELDAVLKAEGNAGPTSLAELLATLKDEYEREEQMHGTDQTELAGGDGGGGVCGAPGRMREHQTAPRGGAGGADDDGDGVLQVQEVLQLETELVL